jgi:hypothetical protein
MHKEISRNDLKVPKNPWHSMARPTRAEIRTAVRCIARKKIIIETLKIEQGRCGRDFFRPSAECLDFEMINLRRHCGEKHMGAVRSPAGAVEAAKREKKREIVLPSGDKQAETYIKFNE